MQSDIISQVSTNYYLSPRGKQPTFFDKENRSALGLEHTLIDTQEPHESPFMVLVAHLPNTPSLLRQR